MSSENSAPVAASPSAFTAAWHAWHEARLRAVRAPHGLASLAHTHWLTPEAESYEGAPGTWRSDDNGIIGEGLTEAGASGEGLTTRDGTKVLSDRVELVHGDELRFGDILLRGMERDGVFALRVLDPAAPGRTALLDISAFEPDASWVRQATFVPADGATIETTSIDGHVSTETPVGRVVFELDGEPVSLTVTGGPNGLSAVIADGTSGTESYRFRFITLPAPAADGSVAVDFNRAYLPPCAFSDHYVCPLPAPNNRLTTRIMAGERLPVLATGGVTSESIATGAGTSDTD